jgi:hypothetical protein
VAKGWTTGPNGTFVMTVSTRDRAMITFAFPVVAVETALSLGMGARTASTRPC